MPYSISTVQRPTWAFAHTSSNSIFLNECVTDIKCSRGNNKFIFTTDFAPEWGHSFIQLPCIHSLCIKMVAVIVVNSINLIRHPDDGLFWSLPGGVHQRDRICRCVFPIITTSGRNWRRGLTISSVVWYLIVSWLKYAHMVQCFQGFNALMFGYTWVEFDATLFCWYH
jgi:hypothetical protein